jgi:hypothetical protein
MEADILQAIQIIDAKIASLQAARNQLAHAFGIVDNPITPSHEQLRIRPVTATPIVATSTPTRNGHGASQPQPSERKIQLALFLMQNGPMSRVAIVEKGGIPEGTVSYCLADKRFFEQNPEGDWDITDYSRRGLEMRAKTGAFMTEHQA